MVLPAHVFGTRLARPSASPLIVKDKPAPISESQELRQQVVVVGARPAMQHEDSFCSIRSVFAPVEWHLG